MKRTQVIVLLLALSLVESAMAGGGPGTKWDAELRARMEATGSVLLDRDNPPGPPSYYVSATRERVAASPDWGTNSFLPPLSLETALTIAHGELKQTNPAFDEFRLTSGGLGRISGEGLGEAKWWYSLHFHGTSRTHRDRWFLVPVLMDGTFVQPSAFAPRSARSTDKAASDKNVADMQGKDAGADPEMEKRLSVIIIPEIDFRQADIRDIIDFYDAAIPAYGAAAERNEETRLRIRVHESALTCEPLPYALPEAPPLLTFAAKNMSLLEALKITMGLAQLKMSIDRNIITLFNPKL